MVADFLFVAAYPFWVFLVLREIDVKLVFSHYSRVERSGMEQNGMEQNGAGRRMEYII